MSSMTKLLYYPEALLSERVHACLVEAGAQDADAEATTRALLHASRIGVDSHGVRLVGHYVRLLRSGGVNSLPVPVFTRTGPATGQLNADGGLAHSAAYRAMDEAVALARGAGIGAVGVHHSSHFGAAGAYVVEAARQGMIGLIMSNSDAAVSLFGGAKPFHGTNPIAMAAPTSGSDPWLMDIATSSIPFNRVKLYRSLGLSLPSGVAASDDGRPTRDAQSAAFLQPLGGEEFGFKGAALAGLVTILAGVLTGAALDPVMVGTDEEQSDRKRQNVGHFAIAIDPARFIGKAAYDLAMGSYLDLLRDGPSVNSHNPVMAPGDREWQEARKRAEIGIPVDPDTQRILGLI
ncbi:LDH2 family malate/lactate/ureidoglycolate dehydrogenase [Gluconobacter cerinus]|uniref:Ldh family oxidoreductase n=1 Tax=Gluconobacter cerinus TaxID=38307 RepID=UPI002226F597|nr:Ldh family oxidoreductase [Gluconobacter cerinus]MCW2265508.1 LDH2 family malate/lactate/ureidoglycolate dehydrogenase [Gluconobacter cerinus]